MAEDNRTDDEKKGSSFKLGDRAVREGVEVRTVEQWAEAKGMLEATVQIPRGARMGQHLVASARPNPNHVFFRQAKTLRGWVVGKEVTEQEFDEAVIEAQQGVEIR